MTLKEFEAFCDFYKTIENEDDFLKHLKDKDIVKKEFSYTIAMEKLINQAKVVKNNVNTAENAYKNYIKEDKLKDFDSSFYIFKMRHQQYVIDTKFKSVENIIELSDVVSEETREVIDTMMSNATKSLTQNASLVILRDNLRDAKKNSWRNSSEYENIEAALDKTIEINNKLKEYDNIDLNDEKVVTEKQKLLKEYKDALANLDNLSDKYLDHKAKDGIKENAAAKVEAVQKLKEFAKINSIQVNLEYGTINNRLQTKHKNEFLNIDMPESYSTMESDDFSTLENKIINAMQNMYPEKSEKLNALKNLNLADDFGQSRFLIFEEFIDKSYDDNLVNTARRGIAGALFYEKLYQEASKDQDGNGTEYFNLMLENPENTIKAYMDSSIVKELVPTSESDFKNYKKDYTDNGFFKYNREKLVNTIGSGATFGEYGTSMLKVAIQGVKLKEKENAEQNRIAEEARMKEALRKAKQIEAEKQAKLKKDWQDLAAYCKKHNLSVEIPQKFLEPEPSSEEKEKVDFSIKGEHNSAKANASNGSKVAVNNSDKVKSNYIKE